MYVDVCIFLGRLWIYLPSGVRLFLYITFFFLYRWRHYSISNNETKFNSIITRFEKKILKTCLFMQFKVVDRFLFSLFFIILDINILYIISIIVFYDFHFP
jgi:hypothetical protein